MRHKIVYTPYGIKPKERRKYPGHPLYSVLNGIKTRCYNPNHERYYRYGGRGITVCDEWLKNSNSFVEWGINNGWQYGLTIDRKDNDKGYSPSNCKFSTYKENNNNRDNTRGRTKKYVDKDIACKSKNRRAYRRWTLSERLALVNKKVSNVTKSPKSILRKYKRNEFTIIEQVKQIRHLYIEGVSIRKLKRMFNGGIWNIITNKSFYCEQWAFFLQEGVYPYFNEEIILKNWIGVP